MKMHRQLWSWAKRSALFLSVVIMMTGMPATSLAMGVSASKQKSSVRVDDLTTLNLLHEQMVHASKKICEEPVTLGKIQTLFGQLSPENQKQLQSSFDAYIYTWRQAQTAQQIAMDSLQKQRQIFINQLSEVQQEVALSRLSLPARIVAHVSNFVSLHKGLIAAGTSALIGLGLYIIYRGEDNPGAGSAVRIFRRPGPGGGGGMPVFVGKKHKSPQSKSDDNDGDDNNGGGAPLTFKWDPVVITDEQMRNAKPAPTRWSQKESELQNEPWVLDDETGQLNEEWVADAQRRLQEDFEQGMQKEAEKQHREGAPRIPRVQEMSDAHGSDNETDDADVQEAIRRSLADENDQPEETKPTEVQEEKSFISSAEERADLQNGIKNKEEDEVNLQLIEEIKKIYSIVAQSNKDLIKEMSQEWERERKQNGGVVNWKRKLEIAQKYLKQAQNQQPAGQLPTPDAAQSASTPSMPLVVQSATSTESQTTSMQSQSIPVSIPLVQQPAHSAIQQQIDTQSAPMDDTASSTALVVPATLPASQIDLKKLREEREKRAAAAPYKPSLQPTIEETKK